MTMTQKSQSMALLGVMVLSLFATVGCGDEIDVTQIAKSPTAPTTTPTPAPTPAVSSVTPYTTNKEVNLSNCEVTITFGVKVLPESAPQSVDDWDLVILSGSGTLAEGSTSATLKTKNGKFMVKAIVNGVSGNSETIEVTGCGVVGTPSEPIVDLKFNGSNGPVNVSSPITGELEVFLTGCTSTRWTGGPFRGQIIGGNLRMTVTVSENTRFAAECEGPGGRDSDHVDVNVTATTPTPTPTPILAPTCPISADHLSIPQGGSTVIRHTSANATSVTGLSGFFGSLPLSDNRSVILGQTTTFTIQCSGPGGTSPPQSVTVTVTAPACPTSIDYSPKGGSINVGSSRALVVDNWPSNVSCDPFWHVNDSSRARVKGTKQCLVDGKPFWCGPAATLEGVFPTDSVRVTAQIAIPLPRPEKSYFWKVVANTLTDMLRLDLSFINNGRDQYGVCQTLACK